MLKLPALVLAAVLTLTCVIGVAAKQKRARVNTESLLSVMTPVHKATSNAHPLINPWINVRVRLDQASDGSRADPATFKAWLGRCRLSNDVFEDVVQDGFVVEKRARLTNDTTRCRLKKGKRPRNRLRFKVKASGETRKQRRLKDVDKVRFGILEGDNHPPEPLLNVDTAVIKPNVEVSFSATGSHDPDDDWLTYEWHFGDPAGTTATGETVTHAYTESTPATITLTASDGDKTATAVRTLPALPVLDPGHTEGTLGLSASSGTPLDFGAVSVGQTETRTFTVQNNDDPGKAPNSQIKFTVEVVGGSSAFSVDCPPTEVACELGPGDQRQITVSFSPTAEGEHAEAVLQLLATASNASRTDLFTHGYGEGSGASGTAPWGTDHTVFYLGYSSKVFATLSDGTLVEVDVGTGTCEGGSHDGWPCVTSGDCPGASCGARLCLGGTSHGSACSDVTDCPLGTCGEPFDPVDLCADGTGSVFLFNDDVHEDLNLERDPPRAGMILRVGLDGSRSVVTDVVAEQSLVIACDRSESGRVFWAQYDIYGQDWDEREQLMSIKKDATSMTTHVANISSRLGDVDPANYIDPDDDYIYFEESAGLRVSPDGKARYVVNTLGLYRLQPTPLVIVLNYYDEQFDVDPDGLIVAADVAEDSTRSTVRVYKIDPNNALNGAVELSYLTPWATMQIPNNRGTCSSDYCPPTARINSVAVDPDGVVFVTLHLNAGLGDLVVPSTLRVKGTARFEPEGDGASGTYTGFVNLERLDLLSF